MWCLSRRSGCCLRYAGRDWRCRVRRQAGCAIRGFVRRSAAFKGRHLRTTCVFGAQNERRQVKACWAARTLFNGRCQALDGMTIARLTPLKAALQAAPGVPQFGAAPAAALGSGGASAATAPPPRQPPSSGLIDDAPSGKQEERPLMEF